MVPPEPSALRAPRAPPVREVRAPASAGVLRRSAAYDMSSWVAIAITAPTATEMPTSSGGLIP